MTDTTLESKTGRIVPAWLYVAMALGSRLARCLRLVVFGLGGGGGWLSWSAGV